jgi:hypothetical protein
MEDYNTSNFDLSVTEQASRWVRRFEMRCRGHVSPGYLGSSQNTTFHSCTGPFTVIW